MVANETNRNKVVSRLAKEGWRLVRNGSAHDIYDHPTRLEILAVPRHRVLSPGVARQIAKIAGWR